MTSYTISATLNPESHVLTYKTGLVCTILLKGVLNHQYAMMTRQSIDSTAKRFNTKLCLPAVLEHIT